MKQTRNCDVECPEKLKHFSFSEQKWALFEVVVARNQQTVYAIYVSFQIFTYIKPLK